MTFSISGNVFEPFFDALLQGDSEKCEKIVQMLLENGTDGTTRDDSQQALPGVNRNPGMKIG